MSYVCTGCGGSSVEVNPARPSVDDRYPIGHCIACTPWPRLKKNPMDPDKPIQLPRKSIPLIRADLFDRDAFRHRQKVEEARRLAGKLHGKKASKMSPEELRAAKNAVDWLQR